MAKDPAWLWGADEIRVTSELRYRFLKIKIIFSFFFFWWLFLNLVIDVKENQEELFQSNLLEFFFLSQVSIFYSTYKSLDCISDKLVQWVYQSVGLESNWVRSRFNLQRSKKYSYSSTQFVKSNQFVQHSIVYLVTFSQAIYHTRYFIDCVTSKGKRIEKLKPSKTMLSINSKISILYN